MGAGELARKLSRLVQECHVIVAWPTVWLGAKDSKTFRLKANLNNMRALLGREDAIIKPQRCVLPNDGNIASGNDPGCVKTRCMN
jgi:hypothetical protein